MKLASLLFNFNNKYIVLCYAFIFNINNMYICLLFIFSIILFLMPIYCKKIEKNNINIVYKKTITFN